MYVALDSVGNRLYADDGQKYTECFCQDCGAKLLHRKGNHNRPHFAHMKGAECASSKFLDKDRNHEWHIRMQGYFPKEQREVRFKDEATGTIHIADVYVPEKNTIIEFQHSPITDEEFLSRTRFHLANGRKMVWIFDESKADEPYGRFCKTDDFNMDFFISREWYKWMGRPRKVLKTVIPPNQYESSLEFKELSICVYMGKDSEGKDSVYKIIHQCAELAKVNFSVHQIRINESISCDEFFYNEDYWTDFEPYKTMKEKRRLAELISLGSTGLQMVKRKRIRL